VVQEEMLWVYYLTLLGELYGKENWEDKLLQRTNNVDITEINYKSINKATINRIKGVMGNV
jgi:hypothetical protein